MSRSVYICRWLLCIWGFTLIRKNIHPIAESREVEPPAVSDLDSDQLSINTVVVLSEILLRFFLVMVRTPILHAKQLNTFKSKINHIRVEHRHHGEILT